MKLILQRLVLYIVGLMILSFGVIITIFSGLGIGAWEALNVGLSNTFGFSLGVGYTLSGLLLVAVNSIFQMKIPDLLALVTTIIIGYLVDMWNYVTGWGTNTMQSNHISEIIIFLLGLVVISTGISIYLQSDWAKSPVDDFMFTISKVTKRSIKVSKIIAELIGLTLALLFSGPIGVGTILFLLLLGPLIEIQYNKFKENLTLIRN